MWKPLLGFKPYKLKKSYTPICTDIVDCSYLILLWKARTGTPIKQSRIVGLGCGEQEGVGTQIGRRVSLDFSI